MKKTPEFIKRIKKFLPKPHMDSAGTIYLESEDRDEIEKFGGQLIPSRRSLKEYAFGTLRKTGTPAHWEESFDGRLDLVRFLQEGLYPSDVDELFEQPNGILGINEWTKCHEWYSKKYKKQQKEFEAKNPIWQKIMVLNSEEMKAALDEKESNAMRSLYEAQLRKDPEYQSLQSLKQDVFDLTTYVKYLEKQRKTKERKGLKGRLESLKTEYNSAKVKEALPDEKTRLTTRGAMHKKLKKRSEYVI